MIKYLSKTINFIFASKCPFCGEYGFDNDVCYSCFSQLNFMTMSCLKCQQPIQYFSKEINVCNKCLDKYDFYKEMICPFSYNKFLKNYILKFKNGNEIYLGDIFARFIYNKARHIINSETIIIPVPLYKDRLIKRGYNQSFILAKSFARYANINCLADAVFRIKDTTTQVNKNFKERSINVKNAFVLNENYDLKGKRILIIDDVITTGATIYEIAKLFENITDDIYILSIARQIL